MNKRLIFSLLLLIPCSLPAQPDPEQLERRLSSATGRERLDLLVKLTTTYRQENPQKAIDFGAEALELLRAMPDEDPELESLNSLCVAYIRLGEYQSALQHGARAERLARDTDDKPALALALKNLGEVHRRLSEYQLALDYSSEALRLYTEIGDKFGLAEVLKDVGNIYRRIDDYSTALEYYFRAQQLYEEAGERQGVAKIFTNVGIVYRKLDQPAKALEFYEQALEIQQHSDNRGAVARLLNNIGFAYVSSGQPYLAIEHFRRSMAIKEELGDKAGIAYTFNNLGSAYKQLGDLETAMDLYRRSFEIKEELGDKKGMLTTMIRIAALQREGGGRDLAVETLMKSVTIAVEINARGYLRECYHELSKTYAQLGRYQEALDAFQRYEQVKDEIFNENNREIIAEMQARYESDQKVKEIEILKQQQAIQGLEIRRQATTRRALLGGFALLLFVVLLLYNRYRLKARSSRVIEQKNLELSQTMTEFKESEHRYHRLFDEPSTAKLLLDPACGTILDANDSAGVLLGRPANELVGKPASTLASQWLDRILSRLDAEETSDPASRVVAFDHGSGEVRDFDAWASWFRFAGRRVALLTLHDVTERRRLEEERLRQEERDRYIGELEARNAEMERFTYTVSHDLKTPLLTIRGFLGVLEQDALAGDAGRIKADIKRISSAAGTMAQLLDDVLELSRIGRVINEPQEVSLSELARDATALVAAQIAAREAEVMIAPDLPVVFGDRPRLLEVLQNLIENAVKFMGDQPAPRVEVACRKEAGENVYYVRDNGIGIAPRYQEKVFDLFDRLDQEIDGTGVGLALVKRIVEVHGGRVWVESGGDGRGSSFCFTLAQNEDLAGAG